MSPDKPIPKPKAQNHEVICSGEAPKAEPIVLVIFTEYKTNKSNKARMIS